MSLTCSLVATIQTGNLFFWNIHLCSTSYGRWKYIVPSYVQKAKDTVLNCFNNFSFSFQMSENFCWKSWSWSYFESLWDLKHRMLNIVDRGTIFKVLKLGIWFLQEDFIHIVSLLGASCYKQYTKLLQNRGEKIIRNIWFHDKEICSLLCSL